MSSNQVMDKWSEFQNSNSNVLVNAAKELTDELLLTYTEFEVLAIINLVSSAVVSKLYPDGHFPLDFIQMIAGDL